ncbi:MAG TPA: hypothetical protein VIX35_00005, partial [Vicinamibacterales bacterium]
MAALEDARIALHHAQLTDNGYLRYLAARALAETMLGIGRIDDARELITNIVSVRNAESKFTRFEICVFLGDFRCAKARANAKILPVDISYNDGKAEDNTLHPSEAAAHELRRARSNYNLAVRIGSTI